MAIVFFVLFFKNYGFHWQLWILYGDYGVLMAIVGSQMQLWVLLAFIGTCGFSLTNMGLHLGVSVFVGKCGFSIPFMGLCGNYGFSLAIMGFP